jgi:lysine-N-methylase
MPLIEGFQNLALLFPVIIWLARWRAACGDRSEHFEVEDVERAISLADHHHGYSPILASAWSRQRVRLLARRNDISKLCEAVAGELRIDNAIPFRPACLHEDLQKVLLEK